VLINSDNISIFLSMICVCIWFSKVIENTP
jgi:hypothetical protein